MTTDEYRIARAVQGILVRNYVDTQKVNVDVTGTSVHLEGELVVFEYGMKSKDPVDRILQTKRMLLLVERQIRRIGDVTSVTFKFRNWERSGTQWFPKRR